METLEGIISSHFGPWNSAARMGGIPVREIVGHFGTPVYVYNARILERQWHLLRSTFPSEFDISYSVKANPNPAILRWFLSKGCGLEVASGGEFHLALS